MYLVGIATHAVPVHLVVGERVPGLQPDVVAEDHVVEVDGILPLGVLRERDVDDLVDADHPAVPEVGSEPLGEQRLDGLAHRL